MNLSTLSDAAFDVSFLAVKRLRRLALAALIAIAFFPHLANGTGVKAGPFEIEFRSERNFAVSSNMNPFKLYKQARYKLRHNGRSVSFSPNSTDGSKRDWFAGDLLEAHFLYSNGTAVVLVCTETGTYLVNDQSGKPVVRRLHEQPTKRFQFLDSAAGQPGDLQELNAGADANASAMGRNLGKTGTLMLLPELNGILDLSTLEFRTYNALKSHKWVYDDPDFGGFSFDESPTGQARVWWPARRQFALVRYRYVNAARLFAFELVDLKTDTAYLVPFDLNQTRLTTLGDIKPGWMNHYFQWIGDKLSLKMDQKSLPWIGSLNAAPEGHFNYNLQPITPEMRIVLLKFLVENFGVVAEGSKQLSHVTGLTIQGKPFKLNYDDTGKTLVLEPEYGSPKALTLQIAEQFNRELAQGNHQALFTMFAPSGFSQ